MKIVKFKDGTYGIRSGNWFSGYMFYSDRNNDWWYGEEYVERFCKYPDYETAELAMKEANKAYRIEYGKRDNGKPV
jgi:hypothetical protein